MSSRENSTLQKQIFLNPSVPVTVLALKADVKAHFISIHFSETFIRSDLEVRQNPI